MEFSFWKKCLKTTQVKQAGTTGYLRKGCLQGSKTTECSKAILNAPSCMEVQGRNYTSQNSFKNSLKLTDEIP